MTCSLDHSPMQAYRVPYDHKSVVVDHCEGCGALWLDHGEIKALVAIVREATRAGVFGKDVSAPGEESLAQLPNSAMLASQQDRAEAPGLSTYFFQLFTGMPVEVWNPVG